MSDMCNLCNSNERTNDSRNFGKEGGIVLFAVSLASWEGGGMADQGNTPGSHKKRVPAPRNPSGSGAEDRIS